MAARLAHPAIRDHVLDFYLFYDFPRSRRHSGGHSVVENWYAELLPRPGSGDHVGGFRAAHFCAAGRQPAGATDIPVLAQDGWAALGLCLSCLDNPVVGVSHEPAEWRRVDCAFQPPALGSGAISLVNVHDLARSAHAPDMTDSVRT